MDRRSALMLSLAATCAAGCRLQDPPAAGQTLMLDGRTLVIEGRDGKLSSVDIITGEVNWQNSPPPEDIPPFASLPTRHLICPLERTPGRTLLARYTARILAIESQTGNTLWARNLPNWARGERRCPKATPDSGTLLLRGNGLFLQKLDSGGRDLWRLSFGDLGVALNPPHVLLPSGDALVQTPTSLVSVSPDGTINWVRPR